MTLVPQQRWAVTVAEILLLFSKSSEISDKIFFKLRSKTPLYVTALPSAAPVKSLEKTFKTKRLPSHEPTFQNVYFLKSYQKRIGPKPKKRGVPVSQCHKILVLYHLI